MVLTPCTGSSLAWEVTDSALPGFITNVVKKGVSGACGPAAFGGNLALGTPFDLYSLPGNEKYCDLHQTCDWVWGATMGQIVHPGHPILCL